MTSIDLNRTATQTTPVKDNYFDQNALNSVKLMGKHNDPQALKEVAKKFEAMFLQQVMKSMRDANEVFNQDNPFSSNEEKFHQDMLDQQLIVNMTSGEGMGLAKSLYAQLTKGLVPSNKSDTPVENTPHTIEPASGIQIKPAFKAVDDKVFRSTSASAKKTVHSSPEAFIEEIKPYAEQAAKELNVGVDVILAQTALETGWGKFVLHDQSGNNTYNLFNIKSGSTWAGDKVSTSTLEFVDGSPSKQKANFRQYQSYEQSFKDYVSLIKNSSRYGASASAKNASEYIDGLQQGGYATDPHYAKKLKQLLNSDLIKSAVSKNPAFAGSTDLPKNGDSVS